MALGRQIALCAATLAAVLGLLGCGSSGNDGTVDVTGAKFTPQNETDFNGKLTVIQKYVDDGECQQATKALTTLKGAVDGVSSDTDEQLKTDLIDLLGRLGDQIDAQCMEAATTTTSSSSSTTTDSSTADSTETPTSTQTTTSTDTTSTETTTTDTKPPKPDPSTPTTPVNPGNGTPPPTSGGKNPNTGGLTPGSGKK